MADTNPKNAPKKRDLFSSRLKTKYPDINVEDDEVLFGRVSDDYDEYDKQIADRDKQLEEYKGREKAFSDMFTSDPRSAAFMQKWRDGEDPSLAFIREFGKEGIQDIINDPAKQEEVAAANKDYAERVTKEKGYEEEYQKNLEASLNLIKSLEEGENAHTSEEVDAAFELLLGIIRDGIVGKFSPESFEMAFKAINHDADVQVAGDDGEVRGRNAKIDEKLRKSKKGDGTAPLGGKNGNPGKEEPKRDYGALGRYGEGNSTIWERGGEKRTKY